MTQEEIKDFTLRITHANKSEMIVILYDIGATYIYAAEKDLERADYMGFRNEISCIRSTLSELMNSVNTSMEIGHNLLRLYIYCSGELTKAYLDYDKVALKHVLNVFTNLRSAYAEVSKYDSSDAVMQNTEEVINNFTYNRFLQSQSISNSHGNRGILA